jgi:hypothetical protein
LADLKKSLRASLCYFQTMRHKVKSLLAPHPRKAQRDNITGYVYQTASAIVKRVLPAKTGGTEGHGTGRDPWKVWASACIIWEVWDL